MAGEVQGVPSSPQSLRTFLSKNEYGLMDKTLSTLKGKRSGVLPVCGQLPILSQILLPNFIRTLGFVMAAVHCPLWQQCQLVLHGGLEAVTAHLQDVHHLRVCDPFEAGFMCQQGDCRAWYQTYKGWRKHVRNHINANGGQAVHNEPFGNAAIGAGMQLPVENEGNGDAHEELVDNPEEMEVEDGADNSFNSDLEDMPVGEGDVDPNQGDQNEDEENGQIPDIAVIAEEDADDDFHSHDEDSDEVEEDSDEEEPPNYEEDAVDLKERAANMILDLRSHCTMNRTEVRRAIKGCDSVLNGFQENVTSKVQHFLERNNLLQNPDSQELLQSLTYSSPFDGMRSDKGQVSAAKHYFKFIPAEKLDVGRRADQVNVGNRQFRQRPVRENFQYVSPKKILKLLLAKNDVMDYVNNLQPRNDGLLTSFTDSDRFGTHPFFKDHPHAFQLSLYYDDFEVVNSESSKIQIHTIAAFYLIVLNVPPHMNSALHSIHVVLLCNYDDLKDRGFRVFLQPLIDDLIDLESANGVPVVVSGQQHTLRACLVAFEGDTKAAHEILEFLGPGARHFCRLCMISRQQLHAGHVILGQPRSEPLHEEHMQMVHANEGNTTLTGIRGTSCLHDLQYFRYWDNKVFDVFHDLVGIAHLVIRAVLRQFICVEEYFRATDLNRRIRAFAYGVSDVKNKPTANFSSPSLQTALRNHTMKQHGSQTFCLLRALPFLLDGLVPDEEENPYLQLLVILQDVVDIAIAPRVPKTILPYFRRSIEDYRNARRELFPTISFINKEHHVEHLPDCMAEMGPMRQYMCMRPEGKHKGLKRHINSSGCFRNAHKTAMEFAQFSQASFWGTDSENGTVKVISAARNRTVNDLFSRELLLGQGFLADDVLSTATKVEVCGTEYAVGDYVITKSGHQNPHGMHTFSKVTCIILDNEAERVWLEVDNWLTDGFDVRLHAYIVSEPDDHSIGLHEPTSLPLHPPLSTWVDHTSDYMYLSLKYFVP